MGACHGYGLCGATFVSVVKPANLGERDHFTLSGCLDGTCDRAVHLKGEVCSGFIVIRDVVGKNSSQMVCAEDNDVVQALSTNGAVESFRIRVLPGTIRRGEDFFDTHILDPPSKPIAIDPVPVA